MSTSRFIYADLNNTATVSVYMTSELVSSYNCGDYTKLITSEHKKPKFVGFAESILLPIVGDSGVLSQMISKLDVDTASGDQLDILGKWVGVNRATTVDLEVSSLYFSFDIEDCGWDYAYWYEDYENCVGMRGIPDLVYRMVIKAKIASNHWDGTTEQARSRWKDVFGEGNVYIIDNQDMSMGVYVSGFSIDSVIYEVLQRGQLSIRPSGVRIDYYIVGPGSIGGKSFSWGIESELAGGWSEGYWVTNITI